LFSLQIGKLSGVHAEKFLRDVTLARNGAQVLHESIDGILAILIVSFF
jgi:hypothetical protein